MPVSCNDYRMTIPLHTPKTYTATRNTTPYIVDWSYINIGQAIKALNIDLSSITGFDFLAQLSTASGNKGHVYLRNYTDDVTIIDLSTTSTSKSNYVATNFNIDKSLLEDEKIFAVYISNEVGGFGTDTYIGKASLIVKFRGGV